MHILLQSELFGATIIYCRTIKSFRILILEIFDNAINTLFQCSTSSAIYAIHMHYLLPSIIVKRSNPYYTRPAINELMAKTSTLYFTISFQPTPVPFSNPSLKNHTQLDSISNTIYTPVYIGNINNERKLLYTENVAKFIKHFCFSFRVADAVVVK